MKTIKNYYVSYEINDIITDIYRNFVSDGKNIMKIQENNRQIINDFSVSKKWKDNYDNHYKKDESDWRWLGAMEKVNNIVSLSNKYPHRNVLEIGSGEGSILKRLSDLQFASHLYSLEISKTAVEIILKRNISSLVECKLFDGYNIPYENNKFDLVILTHVIEHLEYPRKMLYEASRVGKYVFVEVPLDLHLRMKKNYVFDECGHINFYNSITIRKLIQTCDLEILSQKVSNPNTIKVLKYHYGKKAYFLYYPIELFLRLMPNVATHIIGYHCSIICRKKTI